MASSEGSRPHTPPHHPIHGVHVLPETIKTLVKHACPASELVSVVPLPSGRSFNNRIYFLKLQHSQTDTSEGPMRTREQELVLKVNGRFFGPDKIQNEVACLWLLEKHCPNVPVPRVFAWSEDGANMTLLSPNKARCQKTKISINAEDQQCIGWILISKVPGEPISTLELDETMMKALGTQLADLVSCWRLKIPEQKQCGNIRFHSDPTITDPTDIIPEGAPDSGYPAMVVMGLLNDGIPVSSPITTMLEYHKIKLEEKLKQLETEGMYSPNRSLTPLIREFIVKRLPKLKMAQSPNGVGRDSFTFTHYDLSPRNVLVSGEPPRITGIVDFEFAGFFPPLHEFINDYVHNDGDWPVAVYDAYLEQLEKVGVATPAKSFEKEIWKQACELERVEENIAPWWLPGGLDGKDLEAELKQAEKVVRQMIMSLD